MAPFFSVVIPTFNRADFLREAVQSVLDQTFGDYEVIVIDDGSTDHTSKVLDGFSDERIVIVDNDRGSGGAGTRNTGIFRAKGQWVAFLDDDDIWFAEKLQKQYETLQAASPDIGMIYTGHLRFRQTVKETYLEFKPTLHGDIFADLLYKNSMAGFYSVVIRRDILLSLGGLDERFPAQQDHDLYVRVARDYKVACLPEPLVYVRFSDTGRITTNFSRRLTSSKLFLDKYLSATNNNLRARTKMNVNVMIFAFATGEWRTVLRHTPWYLRSVFSDWPGFIEASRFLARVTLDRLTLQHQTT